jgi:hypothetical protein
MTDGNDSDAKDAKADDEPDELELETYDLGHDGKIGVVDAERARWGLVDARLEEIAEEGGVKGALADVAHKIVDKFDNDES